MLQDAINPHTKTIHLYGEIDLRGCVACYLDAALVASGLRSALTIFIEYLFAQYSPNIMIMFTRERTPIGVIEVKNPGNSVKQDKPITSKRIQGQMFTYLALLKTVFGVQNPIGIMTTYAKWKFCQLPDGKLMGNRVFLSTRSVSFDDQDIHRYVISALVKMNKTQVVVPEIIKDNYFLYAGQDGITLRPLPCDERVMDRKLPGSKSSSFFLLRPLGEGGEGKVYFACNSTDRRCALKLYSILRPGDAE